MAKFVVLIVHVLGLLFLSDIDPSLALTDNAVAGVADVYHSTRVKGRSGALESTGPVGSDVTITKGIYRGEASARSSEPDDELSVVRGDNDMSDESGVPIDSPEREDQLSWATQSPGAEEGDKHSINYSRHPSCQEDNEDLIGMYEDIRTELATVDLQYLENASIEDVCSRNGNFRSCNFNFQEYPSNLEMVCNNHGAIFYLTEHSIQCHDLRTMENLYYQFDHYPSCFSAVCEERDAKGLVKERIDHITRSMSEYLDMYCFADEEILRHANDESLTAESSSGRTTISWRWLQALLVAPTILLIHWK